MTAENYLRPPVDGWSAHLPAGADAGALVDGLARGSLPAAFQATARRVPDAVAVRIGGRGLTHGELDHRAGALAAWLSDHVHAGEHVLICAENSVDLVTAYVATLRRGAVAVLASPTLTAPEIDFVVRDADVRFVFVGQQATAAVQSLELTVELMTLEGPAWTLAQESRAADSPEPLTISSTDPALIGYTSGTTGEPKGAVLSHGNVLASARAVMAAWRWSADDVLLHALPLTHQHGLTGIHTALLSGSATVVMPSFDPDEMVELARQERATVLFAVPAIYERLLPEGLADIAALGTLRLAVSGSAPLSADRAELIAHELGATPLERYGTTESGLDVSNPYDGPRLPSMVGLPVPGIELRLAAPISGDASDTAGASVEGEIQIRGPQVFAGYWNRPRDTADAFADGGWFRTGDLGRFDPDTGYLVISGRIKELIITGGMNVSPREVELALEAHPDIVEAGVAGVPSERWGEEVTAWVVRRSGSALGEAELLDHARARLAPYKCPKRVVFVANLPRNALGKLERRRLGALDASDGMRAEDNAWRKSLDAAVRTLWSEPGVREPPDGRAAAERTWTADREP